jgi:Rod binding domain-containing protein
MTLPISGVLPQAVSGAAGAAKAEPAVDPKALQAARDFEAIFLRTLLSSLEKTTGVSGSGKPNTGQSTYGSMVVGALADKISGNGGIGLAEIVAKSLSAHNSPAPMVVKPTK